MEDLGKVDGCYQVNDGGGSGDVVGDQRGISYADLVVAGWVGLARLVLDPEEWEIVGGWHGGLWRRVVEVTDEWRGMSHSA